MSKVLKKKLLVLPARSATPETATWMRVLAGIDDEGMKVMLVPLTAYEPGILMPDD